MNDATTTIFFFNLKVYHTFFDEVEYYKRHVWRCNGPCQYEKPYYGIIKRSMNRAPGAHDFWWNRHKIECGGTFLKISEPTVKKKQIANTKRKKAKSVGNVKTITKYFSNNVSKGQVSSNSILTNNSSAVHTMVTPSILNPKNNTQEFNKISSETTAIINAKSSLVENLKYSSAADHNNLLIVKHSESSATGTYNKCNFSVSVNSNEICDKHCSENDLVESNSVKNVVRNVWSKKFLSNAVNKELTTSQAKQVMTSKDEKNEKASSSDKTLDSFEGKEFGDVKNMQINCIETEEFEQDKKNCSVCDKGIYLFEMKKHLEECPEFTFNQEACIPSNSQMNDDYVICPCCYKRINESLINSHLDSCLTLIALKEEEDDYV